MATMAIRFSVESNGVTRTFSLKKSVVTFGRSKNCTVHVDDPALSRTHCQIEVEEGAFNLRDLNSRNGTFLEDERVSHVELEAGARIRIGNSNIVFLGSESESLDAEQSPATAQWTAQLFTGDRRRTKARDGSAAEMELRRLHRLLTINRKIAAELEIEKVLTLILDTAVDFVGAERGFLVTVEEDGLSIPVARDFWQKDIESPAFEVSRSIAMAVAQRGEPVIAEDASDDDRFNQMASVQDLKIRSVLCVPLKVRGKTVGALYLDNRFTRGTFSEEDQTVLEAFADQAAISLLNSGRFEETREATERWRERAAERGRELNSVKAQIQQLERDDGLTHDYSKILGRSDAMRECLALVDRVTDTHIPVLLCGESGTGKELLARAIHGNGPRSQQRFVPLNCAALASGLVETELFGHAKGAFTDGHRERRGLFETAHEGTLFLDEIGDMDLDMQTRLLRVLETGEIRRVGESRTRTVNARIIAATHRDLDAMIAEGSFREDLYYRLKGVRIDIPPLRDRGDDVGVIIRHFLEGIEPPIRIGAKALRLLAAHPWPGNVRELKNEIRRLATVCEGVVRVRDLSPHIRDPRGFLEGGGTLKEHIERIERDLVIEALRRHEGNKTRAAEALGLSRLGLRKKMARYEISG